MLTSALFASDVIINIRFFWIFHKIWAYNCKCDILATNNAMRLVDPTLERYWDPLTRNCAQNCIVCNDYCLHQHFFSHFQDLRPQNCKNYI